MLLTVQFSCFQILFEFYCRKLKDLGDDIEVWESIPGTKMNDVENVFVTLKSKKV